MSGQVGSTVSLTIDKGDGSTLVRISGIPWFPGLTVLQAMIIAQAMQPDTFNFTVTYHSKYGAFVEAIDDAREGGGKFWMLKIDNKPSAVGVSEAIVIEQPTGATVDVEWTLEIPHSDHAQPRMMKV
jgi:Domain of unknown function (DUF4430)